MYQATIRDAATLGLALQQARLAAGMTQRDLASELGTTQKYVWELEQGKDSTALARLLTALQVTGASMTITVPEGPRDG